MPDYKKYDPKGWCGDPRRGAAMGRRTIIKIGPDFAGKIYLRRVRRDGGGYDTLGTYWGHSADTLLYWFADADGLIDGCLWATDREEAKEKVREQLPRAQFFR